MISLTKDEAMQLAVGDRVLVHTFEDDDKKFGTINTHERHGLIVVYDNEEGYDIIEELFTPFINGNAYANLYKVEGI